MVSELFHNYSARHCHQLLKHKGTILCNFSKNANVANKMVRDLFLNKMAISVFKAGGCTQVWLLVREAEAAISFARHTSILTMVAVETDLIWRVYESQDKGREGISVPAL